MYYTWRHLLLFDHVRLTPAYLKTLADTVKEKGGDTALPDIWGFIDGTHVHVSRPDQDQEEIYSGQKKCHSLKYQAIATPDGLIAHLGGPFSGRRHDARMVTLSNIEDYLHHHCNDPAGQSLNLYGDEGYPRQEPILAPFRGLLTPAQNSINEAMRHPCLCVEWVFGVLSNYWRFCHESQNLRIGMSPVGKFYPVQALLVNLQMCLGRRSSTTSFYDLQPPSVETYLTPYEVWAASREIFSTPDYYEDNDDEEDGNILWDQGDYVDDVPENNL